MPIDVASACSERIAALTDIIQLLDRAADEADEKASRHDYRGATDQLRAATASAIEHFKSLIDQFEPSR